MFWLIPLALIIFAVFFSVASYNKLVASREETSNSWSQIDVQLKRRYDLIPNLVETAKGYLKHEKETLEAVIKARQIAIDASSVTEQAEAENMLTSTLRSLMAVTENYPDLKGDQHMREVQEELTSTENRIGFSRQHYNDTVMQHNKLCEQVPTVFFASMFDIDKADYFELDDMAKERQPVAVAF